VDCGSCSPGNVCDGGGACVPVTECSDSLDNDEDGDVDYPFDPGCSSLDDDDETNCGDNACEGGEVCDACIVDCGSCGGGCNPTTSCAAQGAVCGAIFNGCSWDVCGSCASGEICDVNSCVPTECQDGIDNDGNGFCDGGAGASCTDGSTPGDPGCMGVNDNDESGGLFCGDSICNGNENCGACPGDCGICPNPPGSSFDYQGQGHDLQDGWIEVLPSGSGTSFWSPGTAVGSGNISSGSSPYENATKDFHVIEGSELIIILDSSSYLPYDVTVYSGGSGEMGFFNLTAEIGTADEFSLDTDIPVGSFVATSAIITVDVDGILNLEFGHLPGVNLSIGGIVISSLCGDGGVYSPEECDDGDLSDVRGQESGDCVMDPSFGGVMCQNSTCGDGYLDSTFEDCDDGEIDIINDGSDDGNCIIDFVNGISCVDNPGICGDGYIDSSAGEECDNQHLHLHHCQGYQNILLQEHTPPHHHKHFLESNSHNPPPAHKQPDHRIHNLN